MEQTVSLAAVYVRDLTVTHALLAAALAAALVVRGNLLAVANGYVVFTTGTAVRLRAGVAAPPRATLGSTIFVTVDRTSGEATAIDADAPGGANASPAPIDVADLPRELVALSARSLPPSPPSGRATFGETSVGVGAEAPSARGPVTVTIEVTVPANTPPGDDVYVATDRSNFSPAEIRMERIDARRFRVALGVVAPARLRYEFTRGTYATVERDASGDAARPRELEAAPGARSEDVVARWADLN
jgi:hypothetical protein